MGKASRNKQTRRNGRRWSTIDPDSGETQAFTVYIDDAALQQWERNRRSLRAGGYPDRPPEIDTPNTRMWNLDGGRALPIDIEGAVHTLGVDTTALAVGTWRSSTPGGEFGLKLNVGRRGDGVFVVHLVAESSPRVPLGRRSPRRRPRRHSQNEPARSPRSPALSTFQSRPG